MIKGYAQKNIAQQCFEIVLVDKTGNRCFTVQFQEHKLEPGKLAESTRVPFEGADVLRAIGDALIELEILKDDATSAELKATKFHLEDMRRLIFQRSP